MEPHARFSLFLTAVRHRPFSWVAAPNSGPLVLRPTWRVPAKEYRKIFCEKLFLEIKDAFLQFFILIWL